MNKTIVKHTCENCLYKEINWCFLERKEYKEQPVNVVNKCPEWQN